MTEIRKSLLIDPSGLHSLLQGGKCLAVDCRHDLLNPEAGRQAWLAEHIPGAVHAHLDRDLSSPVTPHTGRHPLPPAHDFAAFLARIGWQPGVLLIAYDAHGGANASRLWWLMKYFGHDCVRLLDGGLGAWKQAGLPTTSGEEETRPAALVELKPGAVPVLTADEVSAALENQSMVLVDARGSDRFAGQNETLDTVAGHVPGARNRPFTENLRSDGRFAASEQLAADFNRKLDGSAPSEVVHMCGSGVTACHNLFALELAGLPGGALYAGSWSEWIRDPQRPVANGPD